MTKLTNEELFQFCEQFALILHSGISAGEGLYVLDEDNSSQRSKEIFSGLRSTLEETGSFAQALKDSQIFPDTMIAYVKVGEETGCLDEVMDSLARHYEQESMISQQIKSAVTYPLLMLGMMAAVIVILLVKVLPVFQQVFRQMGMEMNGFSNRLLNAGSVISRYAAVFLILAALLIGFVLFLFLHKKGRELLGRLITHIPVIREVPVTMDYTRLTQGISMALRSGLDPDTSLSLASALVTQPALKEKVSRTEALMREEGLTFSEALIQSQLFKGTEGRLISIGFQAGAADEVMQKLSGRYQDSSLSLVTQAVSVVEPTIVIVLSLLVGLVLLSVMMPLLGVLSEMMM